MATTTRRRSTAVAKSEPAQVPDLYRPQALDITGEDVALPRMYIGQFSSTAVQDKDVEVDAGDIFVSAGSEDPSPEVLRVEGGENSVLFSILALRKGRSLSVDNELTTYAYDDPDAPSDAWVTYDYTIAVHDPESDLPVKFLLTRTGAPAAKQMNLVLAKQQGQFPAYASGWRLTTVKRQKGRNTYYVARVVPAELTTEQIQFASGLAEMVASRPSDEPTAPSSAPAI